MIVGGWKPGLNTINTKKHSSGCFQGFRRGMSGERIKTSAEILRIP
jgi:hypothetical protein